MFQPNLNVVQREINTLGCFIRTKKGDKKRNRKKRERKEEKKIQIISEW